jgi:predicted Zn-dependent protease with MMP-like domain
MTDQEFLVLVDRGVEALGPVVLKRISNVAIVVEDEPTAEQRAEMQLDPEEPIFGLYEGVPLADRGVDDGFRLPDKITIFKLPILAAYEDPADIVECVENTVWHEVAHHFGWDEEWVAAEERRRGKEK